VGAYAGGLLARLLVGVRPGGILLDWGVGAAGGVIGMLIFCFIPFQVPLFLLIPYEVNIVPFVLGAAILWLIIKIAALRRPPAAAESSSRATMNEALEKIWRRRESR